MGKPRTMLSREAQAMLDDLRKSGLDVGDARKMQVTPLTPDQTYSQTANVWHDGAYRIPYFNLSGKVDQLFFRLRRLTEPQQSGINSNGAFSSKQPQSQDTSGFRYWQPKDSVSRLYLPPLFPNGRNWSTIAADSAQTIYITEGEKKSARACSLDIACAGLGGVWNFKAKKAGIAILRDLVELNWSHREAVIVFDADVAGRASLQGALYSLANELTRLGAKVSKIDLPPTLDHKIGLDDFLLDHTPADFDALEREPFDLNKLLWGFNRDYALLQSPVAVFHHATGDLLTEKDFRLKERSKVIMGINSAGSAKPLEAAAEWLKWPMQSKITRLVYQPRPLGAPRDLGDGSHNLWSAWGTAERKPGDVRLFKSLLDHLFAQTSDANARKWFEQWLAYPLQHPGTKLLSAVVIHGIQGSGKTLLGYTLRHVYGYQNCSEINQSDLHSQFNPWLAHKQFIIADEVVSSNRRTEQNALKAMITRETVTVNNKYQKPYNLADTTNYLFLSNDATPVYLTDDDRRFFVVRVMSPMTEALRRPYDKWYRTPAAVAAIFDYLLSIDLTDFNPNLRPPMTDAKRAVIDSGRSDLETFIIDECIEGYDQVFALGELPPFCDFQTSETIARIYDIKRQTQRATSAIAVGHILARMAELKKVAQLKPVKLDAGRIIKLWAFRNHAMWSSAHPDLIRRHYQEAEQAKKRRFKQ